MLIEGLFTGAARATAFALDFQEPPQLAEAADRARAQNRIWRCIVCARETREFADALYYRGKAGERLCAVCPDCANGDRELARRRAIARLEGSDSPPRLTVVPGGKGEAREPPYGEDPFP
jgi:hypothetical protein